MCLTGCGTDTSFPNVSSTTATSQLGAIQGSNYGGHAPIVGAHVFVLEGYTSANGYGQPAKSLLSASYTGSYPTAKEPSGTAVAGDYYVTTDSNGYFGVSGDYTCDAGYPVYLYAEGGNPQAPSASQASVTVTGASSSTTTPGYTGYLVVTFTTTGTQLLYQGESVTFGTFSDPIYGQFSGTTQTVASVNLTTSQFSVVLGTGSSAPASSTFTTTVTQASAPNNPAIVNLAVLGVCPSTGTANFSYLKFVYMNEVSTAAAAYALGGFFPAPGSSGLTVAGAAAANLSIPQNDSLALLGLQNAALTAGQLYDIQGSNNACSGSTCDGETHIARTTTPGLLTVGTTTSGSATVSNVVTTAGLVAGMTITGTNIPSGTTISTVGTNTLTLSANATGTANNVAMYAGAGSGTVPQTLLSTIGNILANCVDSANTSVASSAAESTQCSKLFGYALSAGTSGTTPIDTATAAIDIAHNPWANVTNLVNLPTGNVPFSPSLATANDLSVGIVYKPTNISAPEGIAVDGKGQIWYVNQSSAYVTTLNPFGGVQYNVNVGGQPDYIAIDGNGTAWFNNASNAALERISSAGAYVGAYDAGNVYGDEGVAVDGTYNTGYIYIGSNTGSIGVDKFDGNGNAAGPGNPLSGSTSCLGSYTPSHIATDNAGNGYNLWLTSEQGDLVCEVNSISGALISKFTINSAQGGSSYSPETIAIDASGNAWIPNQSNASITKITQSGTVTNPSGGTLSGAFGVAVDGAGNVFVTNRTGNAVTEYLGSTSVAASSVNYEGGGNTSVMNGPLSLQVDPSGNIWITNYSGNSIVELLGVAAPTYTPLSTASYYNKLGSKP